MPFLINLIKSIIINKIVDKLFIHKPEKVEVKDEKK